MSKIPGFSAMAALFLSGGNVTTVSGDSPPTAFTIQPDWVAAAVRNQATQPSSFLPRTHTTRVYSMVVVVPDPIDRAMITPPANPSMFNMPCIKPEMNLEKR